MDTNYLLTYLQFMSQEFFKRYNSVLWVNFDDYDINLLKAENRKNKKIFEKIDNDLICQEGG